MNDENKYQHDDCQDYVYQEDVFVFVNQDKPYCGPVTKCYGLIFCLFFFPGLFCLPCCLCDKKKIVRLRNKNSFVDDDS